MAESSRHIRISLILLVLYFFLYQHQWFSDWAGEHYYVLIHSVFIMLFVWATGSLRSVVSYYSIRKINRRSIKICSFYLLLIIIYRISQLYFFKPGFRAEMIAAIHENGPISIKAPLEDLFFIGIVFCSLRAAIRMRGEHRDTYRAGWIFVISFLITFYWFLVPHQYSNHFLDPGWGTWARIRDFPVDILFGFLCGTLVFVKTRSLILAGICHVVFNGIVWWYVMEHYPP